MTRERTCWKRREGERGPVGRREMTPTRDAGRAVDERDVIFRPKRTVRVNES